MLNFSATVGRSPFNGCGLLASRFVGWVVGALLGWGGILFLALFLRVGAICLYDVRVRVDMHGVLYIVFTRHLEHYLPISPRFLLY